jgi:hypothetical protein
MLKFLSLKGNRRFNASFKNNKQGELMTNNERHVSLKINKYRYMKRLLKYCFLLLLVNSCDSEDSGDCFQKAGDIEQYEINVSTFTKILVNEHIELIIKDGPVEKVVLETGIKFMSDEYCHSCAGRSPFITVV